MHFHTSRKEGDNDTSKYFQAFDFETEHISIDEYTNQSYIPIRKGNNNMSNIY